MAFRHQVPKEVAAIETIKEAAQQLERVHAPGDFLAFMGAAGNSRATNAEGFWRRKHESLSVSQEIS